jgi:hypothetical protein
MLWVLCTLTTIVVESLSHKTSQKKFKNCKGLKIAGLSGHHKSFSSKLTVQWGSKKEDKATFNSAQNLRWCKLFFFWVVKYHALQMEMQSSSGVVCSNKTFSQGERLTSSRLLDVAFYMQQKSQDNGGHFCRPQKKKVWRTEVLG